MALKKKSTPAFEDDDYVDTPAAAEADKAVEVVEQEQQAEETPQVQAQDRAKVEATTAIAKAKGSALAKGGSPFKAALTELENQLSLDHVKALGVGTLPKLVADRAGFEYGTGDGKKEYGNWIIFEIYSFNKRWVVTAGVDGDAGKSLLRTSYDNETLEGEAIGVKEYLGYLKDEGYEKADVRPYYDCWGFVRDSDKLGPVPAEEAEMIQLQLSKSSLQQFTAYQIQAGIIAARSGKEPSNVVKAIIERKEFDSNKYAQIRFSAA